MSGVILPGAAIGVLGSGQLGRMLALAARRMGYRVHVYSPERDTPAGQVADAEVVGEYEDLDAVRKFAEGVDVATFEFENVPAATAAAVGERTLVRPGGSVLHIAQNRLREKSFLTSAGVPRAEFRAVGSLGELRGALGELGCPAVLKTAGFGYDGKGQVKIGSVDEAASAWEAVGGQECVLEEYVEFAREVSVVAVRGADGEFVHYGVIENAHSSHILDVSVAPGSVPPQMAREAGEISRAIMEKLDAVGVVCVEFFVTTGGGLLVNEIAPRPHNSGHLTIEACACSQFEQQARAVCGLPLGSTEMVRPAAMANLLGDLWEDGEPNWAAALAMPGVALHLYGKAEARVGRKMGHFTALGASAEEAEGVVREARAVLNPTVGGKQ